MRMYSVLAFVFIFISSIHVIECGVTANFYSDTGCVNLMSPNTQMYPTVTVTADGTTAYSTPCETTNLPSGGVGFAAGCGTVNGVTADVGIFFSDVACNTKITQYQVATAGGCMTLGSGSQIGNLGSIKLTTCNAGFATISSISTFAIFLGVLGWIQSRNSW